MIVSAGTSANEYLAARLAELGYARPVIVPSAAEARRRMMETEFEMVVVNAPLPDEFGHEVCIDAAEKTDAGVVFLAKAAVVDEMSGTLSDYGILVLAKPFSAALLMQVLHVATGANRRMQRLRQETARLQEKIVQLRLVSRAKCCLVEHEHITEAEAHRRIEKAAMDTRRERGEVAQEILDSYTPDGV
jgi:response regulator NasT